MFNSNLSIKTSDCVSSSLSGDNQVRLTGKVSKVGPLQYAPSGTPIAELIIAVQQTHLEKTNVGYFEVVLSSELAEKWSRDLKIGMVVDIEGSLWSRTFLNRQGIKISETKVLAKQIGGNLGRENKKI